MKKIFLPLTGLLAASLAFSASAAGTYTFSVQNNTQCPLTYTMGGGQISVSAGQNSGKVTVPNTQAVGVHLYVDNPTRAKGNCGWAQGSAAANVYSTQEEVDFANNAYGFTLEANMNGTNQSLGTAGGKLYQPTIDQNFIDLTINQASK